MIAYGLDAVASAGFQAGCLLPTLNCFTENR